MGFLKKNCIKFRNLTQTKNNYLLHCTLFIHYTLLTYQQNLRLCMTYLEQKYKFIDAISREDSTIIK